MSKESDDQERTRNLLIYKMYLTDKERQELPWGFFVFLGVVVIILMAIAELAK